MKGTASMDLVEELERFEPKAFEGELSILPLPELLQYLHIGAKGGVMVVHDDTGRPRAVLYYDRARLIHATCDGIQGREAVYAAMCINSGRFEYFAGQLPRMPEQTIEDSVQNLILEGLRRIDEISFLTRLLPDDDHPLYLAPEPPQDDIRLTAKEWRILSLVNGKRSLRQIIEAAERGEEEVRAVLVALVTADLVVDRRDDSFLDAIVPRLVRQDEVKATRYAPPTLIANLLLKQCDGHRTARMLMEELQMDEREFLEELKLLVRTQWLDFREGEEVFERIAAQ